MRADKEATYDGATTSSKCEPGGTRGSSCRTFGAGVVRTVWKSGERRLLLETLELGGLDVVVCEAEAEPGPSVCTSERSTRQARATSSGLVPLAVGKESEGGGGRKAALRHTASRRTTDVSTGTA